MTITTALNIQGELNLVPADFDPLFDFSKKQVLKLSLMKLA